MNIISSLFCFLSLFVVVLFIPLVQVCHGFSMLSSSSLSAAVLAARKSVSITSTTALTATTSSASSTTTYMSMSMSTSTWKPKISSLEERRQVLRNQPYHSSERIGSVGFHHVEFYCGDARSTAQQFVLSLGMTIAGTTSQATGNDQCVSYALQSGTSLRFLLTAPYSIAVSNTQQQQQQQQDHENDENNTTTNMIFDAPNPWPNFDVTFAHNFFQKHGLAVRALAIEVQNATQAYHVSVDNGATSVVPPTYIHPCPGQEKLRQQQPGNNNNSIRGCTMAEVQLYGDVVLRYISFDKHIVTTNHTTTATTTTSAFIDDNDSNDETSLPPAPPPFLPHLAPYHGPMSTSSSSSSLSSSSSSSSFHHNKNDFGIYQIDHAVGNVPNLQQAYSHIQQFTGFHEFAEFTSEDVGTVESGLNSVVLASDKEHVLLPLNEPVSGRRKSQIQTFLEQHQGAGLQHLALKTRDIFGTVRNMRRVEQTMLGFELMKRPSSQYYQELPDRLGDKLTHEQYGELEELGILADADDEGVLLQLFTKPVGDRPTFFFEIIQRIGCVIQNNDNEDNNNNNSKTQLVERPGCGGFGQGNFRELFKSIEEHEKTLKV
jgi:4-hydroxyphenylpyruvate dioxygenase